MNDLVVAILRSGTPLVYVTLAGVVAQRAGIWLAGFAALAAITGWVGSIGSVLKDDGRVRAGASCLLAIPIVSLVMGIIAVSSTVERPTDPLPVLWVIISGLLLLVGTLLIVLPEHLGTS